MVARVAPDYGMDLSLGPGATSLVWPDGETRTLGCFDATEDWTTLEGRPLLVEALLRRITTPRGALLDDPNYGTDVTRWLNDDVDDNVAGRIAAEMDAEIKKDDRVKSSSTLAVFADSKLTTTTTIMDQGGPFKLTLEIDAVTLKVLGVSL